MFANRSDLANFLIYLVLGGVVLYVGRSLFIPLSFALLISFIVYPACARMERKGIPKMAAIIISVLAIMLFLVAVIALLFWQIISFSAEWTGLKAQLMEAIGTASVYLYEHFNITRENQEEWLKQVVENSTAGILSLLKTILFTSGVSAVLLLIIPVYAVLILFYRKIFVDVLFSLFPKEERKMLSEILAETILQYHNFIKGMLLVYLIVGVLNSIGLFALGIKHAIFFGFVASILTFIPYVGIMVAALLPITVSWLTYDSLWYPVGVIVVFSIVQYLEANIIYPLVVGGRMHLNALMMLIAIIIGGILWGAAGMILFIPFLAIVKLIADKNKGWEPLARLLGEH